MATIRHPLHIQRSGRVVRVMVRKDGSCDHAVGRDQLKEQGAPKRWRTIFSPAMRV